MEEIELIKSKPAVKIIPILMILTGIVLLIITITTHWSWDDLATVMYFVSPIMSIIGIILYCMWSSVSITVTNKRVYGKAFWGSRVDIPLDSISAVGTVGLINGIIVSSSSGKISFAYISNSEAIHSTISKLLNERQRSNTKINEIVTEDNNISSDMDRLREYKKLLDDGIISTDDFEKKKAEILNKQ